MKEHFIKTQRISFGIWEAADLASAKILWQDPKVTKYISASGVFSDEEIQARLNLEIENQNLYNIQYWPFVDNETGELIGCCGFRPYKSEGLEFGTHIRSKFWRKGFGLEAGSAAISYCFENLRPKLIAAGHNPNNTASKELLTKLGFVFSHFEYYAPTGLDHPTYFFKTK